MITVRGLTKRFGDVVAVENLSFDVRPGVVTGFLGPNGAGKSTTMRMILGLDRPTDGQALVNGKPYQELDPPLRHVGALIESDAFHPSRSARSHLRVAVRSNGIRPSRVDAVLEQVGLAEVADRRVKTFSLGMRQRLGIAATLLGDPPVLMFDEPVNGLDADGVRWVRQLVRDRAAEGRTVLVSSHLMNEMQQTADHLIVIGRGRVLTDAPIADVLALSGASAVRVRTPDPQSLAAALARADLHATIVGDHELRVVGGSADQVGELARRADLAIHELSQISGSLEDSYLRLTQDSRDYRASDDREVEA